jgi:hypothetical protein
MGINWDEFDTPGDYPQPFKFRNKGDRVAGEVYYIRTTDFGGTADKVPEIWIRADDGTEWGVAASQVNLRRLLCQHRPAVGDRIAIVYSGDATSTKAGFSPAKQFDVALRRKDSPASAAVSSPVASLPVAASEPVPTSIPTPAMAPAAAPQPVTADSLI